MNAKSDSVLPTVPSGWSTVIPDNLFYFPMSSGMGQQQPKGQLGSRHERHRDSRRKRFAKQIVALGSHIIRTRIMRVRGAKAGVRHVYTRTCIAPRVVSLPHVPSRRIRRSAPWHATSYRYIVHFGIVPRSRHVEYGVIISLATKSQGLRGWQAGDSGRKSAQLHTVERPPEIETSIVA